MIDDSTIDKKGRSLGYYATYKQAKAVAKQHVENMLLDMAIKQAELLN